MSTHHRFLIVPGLHNSGPDHWQTRWEVRYPFFERVVQERWDQPDLSVWSQRLREQLGQSTQPTIIIAHSFGCLTTMRAAAHFPNVVAALLVAPADPDKFGVADELRNSRLRCPSMIIGSEDDPWMAAHRAAYWAHRWRCDFLNAGSLGHINAESGLGDWEQGLQQLAKLMDSVKAPPDERTKLAPT